MDVTWTSIMGAKTWNSPTPGNAHKATGAWQWVLEFFARADRGSCPPLGAAQLCRLVPAYVVVRKGGQYFASFGNAKWACLGWPLERFTGGMDGMTFLRWNVDRTAQTEWFYVVDAKEWSVVPFKALSPTSWKLQYPGLSLAGPGILLQQTEAEVPLLRYSLRSGMKFDHKDLVRLSSLLNCGTFGTSSRRADILSAVAGHSMAGEPEDAKTQFVKDILEV